MNADCRRRKKPPQAVSRFQRNCLGERRALRASAIEKYGLCQIPNLSPKGIDVACLIGSRDDDDVCSTETTHRFAQATVRQQMSAAPRVCRVDRDDVQVTREAQVLKTIVQNEAVGVELSDCFVARRYSIRATDHRSHAARFVANRNGSSPASEGFASTFRSV